MRLDQDRTQMTEMEDDRLHRDRHPKEDRLSKGNTPRNEARQSRNFEKQEEGAQRRDNWISILLAVLHLITACIFALQLSANPNGRLATFFQVLRIDGHVFFSQLFITGTFLYGLLLALWHSGIRLPDRRTLVCAVLGASLAVSILIAADRGDLNGLSARAIEQKSIWSLLYSLLVGHQALLLLGLITIVGVIAGVYYISRSVLDIQYEGSGIQIRLPGQTVYYVPIFPQVSWQPTGILVKKGDAFCVEIYGHVSPGALQEIPALEDHMCKFVDWQKTGSDPDQWAGPVQAPTWRYTGPEGYKEEWYKAGSQLEVLKHHPIYRQPDFYKEDNLLTIKGLPHNRVVGIIRAQNGSEPLSAGIGSPAYNWANPDDREQLINLSSDKYPFTVEAPGTGELWVVINDVDVARWDNGGMFFLKVTCNPRFPKRG
jgi:hypothetical protein